MTRGFLELAGQTTEEVSSSFNKQSGQTSNTAQHIGAPAARPTYNTQNSQGREPISWAVNPLTSTSKHYPPPINVTEI